MRDEISIFFDNPAKDPLGHEAVSGKVLCSENELAIHFEQKDRAFQKFEAQSILLTYSEVETVTYQSSLFGPKVLTITTRQSDKLSTFPGAQLNRLELHVTKESRSKAKTVPEYVDFQLSEAYLAEKDDQLRKLTEG